MHATGQNAALARLCSLGDRHRHIPMLSGRHLNALKIQKVLLSGFQVVDVEQADDFLPLDHIAGIDCPLRCTRCRVASGCRRLLGVGGANVSGEYSRRADRGNRCNHKVAAIEAFFRVFRHDGVLCHCGRRRSYKGTPIGSKVRATSNYGNALNPQGCVISAGTMSTMGEVFWRRRCCPGGRLRPNGNVR